ncbi:CAP domain-containing protein [Halalkalibacter sp. APA_J-10(15)]|uniref:CAP domain-containing protein n=1 Tax=Halalkalibacter sp. APA_J-10(15) TaxID=2933805 RepID=UPI001FF3761B|nr:CAP domain-containing protein [Halalkalibacter sp. APA_J-10(15)]MCK0473125.1 CAP domain-containing protein [Halalkalibacter sp. APA_J-10(15)]
MKKMKWITIVLTLLLFTACNQADEARNGNMQNRGTIGQLSSDYTTESSEEFPHTKPIQLQHAKYDYTVQNSQEITRAEIEKVLPTDVLQQLPQNIRHITVEDLERFIPEGATQLSPEQIMERIQQGGGHGHVQQPTQPERPQQGPDQQRPEAPDETTEQQPDQETEQPEQEDTEQQTEGISEVEQQVIDLTNQERRNNGLPELQADSSLSHVAREKSRDMQQNNYFSHTSPTYGSPFDMMRDYGVSYNSAGENIAQGQRSAQEVVQAWMNSEGHRANILSNDFTHIGVGYIEQGNYWTQMFISR